MAMPPFPDLMNIVAFRDLPAAIAAHIANFQECPYFRYRRCPCLISQCGPSHPGLPIGPGKAKTSRPCSSAHRAVTSEPLRRRFNHQHAFAKPADNPITTRKVCRSGLRGKRKLRHYRAVRFNKPHRQCLMPAWINAKKTVPQHRDTSSFTDSAALWATPSIPQASPLVIVKPLCESCSHRIFPTARRTMTAHDCLPPPAERY
jgi:hypothetical protein